MINIEDKLIQLFQSLSKGEIKIEDIELTQREIKTIIIGLRVCDAFDDALSEALGLEEM